MFKKDGYAALLGLLIVLVIGMMIYFLDMKAIFGPNLQYQTQRKPEDHPWDMENLLIADDQTISVPRKGQPLLLEPVSITAAVSRKNAPRGSVGILFEKDCRIIANWSCSYEYENKIFHIQTQMKGNTVSSRVYSDAEENPDNTRLFFIGKGPYTQTTQWASNPPQTEQGTAYITGWLSPDNAVRGAVTITTDQAWSAVYDFQSNTEKSSSAK